jgi:predicted nucleic acid-binding protein
MSDTGLAFVDTNILVYAFDRGEERRRKVAAVLLEELMREGRFCISTQVLQEFFVTVTRKIKTPIAAASALELMDDLGSWNVLTVDYQTIREAGERCGKLKLSFWDALIVMSARRMGAKTLYTEDLNNGQVVLGVAITNPFTSSPTRS